MPSFGPEAIDVLKTSMNFRMARETVLASNVANVDTPGYRRRDLSFEGVLERTASEVRRTDPRHLVSKNSGAGRFEVGPRGDRPDGNGVDLDQELVAVSRNSGAFIDQANVLARLSTLVRTAIGQG